MHQIGGTRDPNILSP